MKKREIKKGVVFLLCVILVFIYINIIFSFPSGEAADGSKEKWNTFYAMEENTLDAVYLGTSSVDRYWISPQAWKETGMAVYPFAISSISSSTSAVVMVYRSNCSFRRDARFTASV